MLNLAPLPESSPLIWEGPNTAPATNICKTVKACEFAEWIREVGVDAPTRGQGAELSVMPDDVLSRVLSQIDGSKKRMIWLVNGCTRIDHLRAILATASPCSRVVNVLLPDEPRMQSGMGVSTSLGPQFNDRLFLVTAGTPSEQVAKVNALIDVDHFVGWKPVLLPTQSTGAIAHLQQFYRELTTYLNHKAVTRMTKIGSSHLFLANALVNAVFANKINDIEIYKDIHKDRPALVVSTGPSLNKQLELLEKYKDLFLIIAVDPAIPILKERGIIPHFVLSIDPKKRPYWKQDELDERTTFVIDIGCCPDVAWSSNKKYLVTSCHSEVHRIINELGGQASRLMTGGSVSTNAFNLAHWMGANPIVLIGQDLAWTDGKDHAEGYVSQYSREVLEARRAKGFEIPGYDGKPVQTERQLLYYKTWFEKRIQQIPETLVVNATEGGALIEGAAHVPFVQVCEEISKSNLKNIFKDPTLPWQPDFYYLDRYQKNLTDLKEKITVVHQKLEKVIGLIKNSKKDPKKSLMRKIDEVNRILKDGDPTVKVAVEMFGQARVAAVEHKIMTNEPSDTMRAVIKAYSEIYEGALAGSTLSISYIDQILNLLNSMLAGREFSSRDLTKFGLNRWTESGERNKSAI